MEILTIVLLARKRPIKQTEKYLPQLLMNIQSPLKDIIKPWWSMSLEDVSYFLQSWFRLYSNATLFEKVYQWKEKQGMKIVRKKTRQQGHLSKSESFTHLNFVNLSEDVFHFIIISLHKLTLSYSKSELWKRPLHVFLSPFFLRILVTHLPTGRHV